MSNGLGFCESIGGEDAVVERLGELIHRQRLGANDGSRTCAVCQNRAREFFDAAAVAEWWPLGYGIFKMLSNLMDCTEDERKYATPEED